MPVPEGTRTLVLNDDRTPLNTISWKRAFKRLYMRVRCEHCHNGYITDSGERVPCSYCNGRGKLPPADVVEYYDGFVCLDSAGREHLVPSIIVNRHHAKKVFRKIPFSRVNIYRRDAYTCQYCGKHCKTEELTLDHVVPRSMWTGPGSCTDWHNIVAACTECNRKKDNKTPEQAGMQLRRVMNGKVVFYKKPKQATQSDMIYGGGNKCPPEWEPYVKHLKSC